MSSRWRWRAVATVVMWAACLVAGWQLALEPDPVRTLLVVALLVALSGLFADSAIDPAPEWHPAHPEREDWRGHDQRTAFYVRMLESHLTAREPDTIVRDRLVRLAEQTLRTRHGIDPHTVAASELIGPEIAHLAASPPHRMSPGELDGWLTRIERL